MNSNSPLIFLDSWLNSSILECINKDNSYTNPLVKKNFINDEILVTPIIRIFRFLKITESNGLSAILSDSTHKVLAIFPLFPTITDFEAKYKQRITFHTTNSLMLIKQANLKFVNKFELESSFGIRMNKNVDVIVLEILGVEIFQRDQILLGSGIEKSLKFIYDEEKYVKRCEPDENSLRIALEKEEDEEEIYSS